MRFRAVQEAYETLADTQRRQDYDENRRRNLLDSPIEVAGEIWQRYFDTMMDGVHRTRSTLP